MAPFGLLEMLSCKILENVILFGHMYKTSKISIFDSFIPWMYFVLSYILPQTCSLQSLVYILVITSDDFLGF